MQRYDPRTLEAKWQKTWEDKGIYAATEDPAKPKRYVLEYFPYPSGAAMHVGHVRNYTIGDAMARYYRMSGYNVMHPMGWDAFGLPAENYAIKNNISPQEAIAVNTAKFKQQLMQMGFSYDWSREINSSDPKYYKWTQWFFKLLLERGLAYQKDSLQWWCETDQTVLANEQVEAGKCWRCGNEVTKKALKQWFFKITDYADRLVNDLDGLDWSESIKSMQRNWIGKSKGAEVDFAVSGNTNTADFVLLHGFKGSSQLDFFPWLKKNLEADGANVYAPDLPNTAEPNIDEQVNFLLQNHEFSEKTVIITHSLGGVVAMKLLPKLQTKIASLVMVAPPLKTVFKDNKHRPALENACDWQFDFAAAKEKAESITVLADRQDDVVIIDQPQEIATKLAAHYVEVVANGSHFNSDEEPAILNVVKPKITVFTTRPDTLFGATFMVLAPEHPLVKSITSSEHKAEVEEYIKTTQAKSDIERQETEREKTGVPTGAYAINPVNNEQIPVWISDYVLYGYGTGAIMAVPAHDERDFGFAKKFDLPIVRVISNEASDEECSHDEGTMINSGEYDGMLSQEAREKIVADLSDKGTAQEKINYKIRDWLISRQRYWGAPIPIIHCEKDGAVPVPDDQLPVVLPELTSFQPKGGGTSVLASVPEWVNVDCPKCGGPAKRETDTMDGFACSSWYFLRFADPHNDDKPFSAEKAAFWLPVDDYIGGAEHAVMHLLYARMWTKVMYDAGLINFDEPFKALRNHGMILAPDGRKMSKSWGNVIAPDDIIAQGYGADSVRLMELFIGPWDQSANWSTEGMGGVFRFLQRVWTITHEYLDRQPSDAENADERLLRATHQAIAKVSEDMHQMGFNTAIAGLMEFVNELYKIKAADKFASSQWPFALKTLLQLLAPFAPHITEELWQNIGQNDTVHASQWPVHDASLLTTETITIVVQVNGKLRGEVSVPFDADEQQVLQAVNENEKITSYLGGRETKKTIYVPKKLLNLVV